jgi:trans-2,3-dihydro-3-hydroxyanthranilate isomerase
MKRARFVRVDVFAKKPFGGNPLAVFPDARGLTGKEMQLLAREMNLSETTFVVPPTKGSGADFRVRIFTPDMEIAYAGHPTLGTFFVLAREGRIKLRGLVTTALMEVKAGVLPVEIHSRNGIVHKVVTVQKPPVFGAVFDAEEVADCLSLKKTDLALDRAPVQLVSTGIPWVMVLAKSRAVVEKASGNTPVFAEFVKQLPKGAVDIYLTCLDPVDKTSTTHSRGFSLVLGSIVEDPATGSASGCLGSYLARYKLLPPSAMNRIVNEQGYEMGRPSKIEIEVVSARDGKTKSVRVGGPVVHVMDGTAFL